MSTPCTHQGKIRSICVYEGCQYDNLLVCNDCFYSSHDHLTSCCVRVDYAKKQMNPYVELSKKKLMLEQEVLQKIEDKKRQLIEFIDKQGQQLIQKYSQIIEIPQLKLLSLLDEDFIPNKLQSDIRMLFKTKNTQDWEQLNNNLIKFQSDIQRISDISLVKELNSQFKRPDLFGNKDDSKSLSKKKIHTDNDSDDLVIIEPYQIIEDCKNSEQQIIFDESVKLKCIGFQQAIEQLKIRKNSHQLIIEIQGSKSEQKYCTPFFENLSSLKNLNSLNLTITKSFVVYDFILETLLKSINKIPFLKEIKLQFTTKSDLKQKEYLMPKLLKKFKEENIQLVIHKHDDVFY